MENTCAWNDMEFPGRHLVLIRHGESELNVVNRTTRVFCGQYATPLTDRGREQAHAAGQLVAARPELRIRQAVSSALDRATESLELLVRHLPPPVEVLPSHADLNERSLGDFEGQAEEDVFLAQPQYRDDDRFNRFGCDFVQKAPGGENLTEVTTRAWNHILRLWRASVGDLLVMSHCIAIRCILGQALQLQKTEAIQLRIPNAVPIVLRHVGNGVFERL